MSQEIGRFAPDEALRRFVATLTERHDPLRPLGRYKVVDNSRWSAVGDSWVAIDMQGARKLAIYRDGPQPAVGSFLQCVRTGPEATAPWLALPQAPVAGGVLLFSALDATTKGVYALVRFSGGVWTTQPHPITRAVWDRSVVYMPEGTNRPTGYGDGATYTNTALFGGGTFRDTNTNIRLPLATVGARAFAWVPGPDGLSSADDTQTTTGYPTSRPSSLADGRYLQAGCINCLVSDDGGATWADFAALRAVRQFRQGGAVAYCIHDDGLSLSRSTDGGVTWTLRATQPSHTPSAFIGTGFYSIPTGRARWWRMAVDPVDPAILTITSKEGFFTSFDGGATFLGPLRPGGYTLHYEGYTRFVTPASDPQAQPANSDYWYDDFVCADVIRKTDGSGFIAYWYPALSGDADARHAWATHLLVGTDDRTTGGSIAAGRDMRVGNRTYPSVAYADSASRFYRDTNGDLLFACDNPVSPFYVPNTPLIFRSTDGGATWVGELNSGGAASPPPPTSGLAASGGVRYLAAGIGSYNATGTTATLWRRDGATWTAIADGATVTPGHAWRWFADGLIAP